MNQARQKPGPGKDARAGARNLPACRRPHSRCATSGGGAAWPFLAWLPCCAWLFLTQKPLHHDEGVNGLFLANLFRTGYYHYDPSNYHGPTLYYIAVLPTAINNLFHWGHGLSTFAIRYVTAAFGVGIVWLMLCLRRFLGTPAALAAAALATVSAGFVFFSRYFIHEILFVFFSLGVIVAWLWYRDTGKPRYLMLASASAAMLFATKETWIITAAVWLIAIPCTTVYLRLRRRSYDAPPARMREQSAGEGQDSSSTKLYLKAAALFVAIGVLFYSSFFTHPQGHPGFSADVHLLDQNRPNRHLQPRVVDLSSTGSSGRSAHSGSGRVRRCGRAGAGAQLFHRLLRLLVHGDLCRLLSCPLQDPLAGAEHHSAADHHGRLRHRRSLPARTARLHHRDRRSGHFSFSLPGDRRQFCELR